jgi:hypothetical protein
MLMIRRLQELEASGQQQVVLGFARRAHGDLQESTELRLGAPAAALGDVCRNRDCCAPELSGQAVDLLLRESCARPVDSQHQFVRLYPNLQVVEVAHELVASPLPKRVTLHGFRCMMWLPYLTRSTAMERFLKRHEGRINGIITGFDRVLFRGSLRSISYWEGLDAFLATHRVLYKNFSSFVQQLSDRLKINAEAIARRASRPFRYLESAKISKEEIALEFVKRLGIRNGLVCVLSCVEPCKSFTIRRDREKRQLRLVSGERKCLHLYFYFLDRDFGLMHVRLQTWLPFTIRICINGWEWLGHQLARRGIGYEQRDNCFVRIDDLPQAQRMLDSLTERKWAPCLNAFARQVNPWIRPESPLKLHPYYWSVEQAEYATDAIFRDTASLKSLYPALLRHAMEHFGSEDVLRFLGRRTNSRFKGEVKTDLKLREEGTRIKHWAEENSIKMYDKQGCVLRIETTINNPRRLKVRRMVTRKGIRKMAWVKMRKGIVDIRRRVEVSRSANERYLEALAVVGEPSPSWQLLDPVSKRVVVNGRTYRGLRPISPQEAEVFRTILHEAGFLDGFRNRDLREKLFHGVNVQAERQASSRTTRLLRLLRAHKLIRKVPGTRNYRVSPKGHAIMTTATRFREPDLALLAA